MAPLGTFSLRTPPLSAGAIALFDLQGEARAMAAACGFGPLKAGKAALRNLLDVDTGLVILWDDQHLSLMPHGGVGIVNLLREALLAHGLQEGTHLDPCQAYPEARSQVDALALEALARALSPRALEVLLAQHDAHASGLPPAPEAINRALRHLVDPPLVVALGPPNIGKSTLCNALAGASVSIVADEPGTTRDAVGVLIDLDGLVVRYVDAPGIAADAVGVDQEAQRLALDLAAHADLQLGLCDPLHPPLAIPFDLPKLVVCLRADLGPERWHAPVAVSVARRTGLDVLAGAVRRALVPDEALRPCWAARFWIDACPPGVS